MSQEEFLTSLQHNKLPLLFAGIGILLFLIGATTLFFKENEQKGVIIEEAASTTASASAQTSKILVDVSGAVLNPGVYNVSEDARVQEALIKAGGFAENADRDYIAKKINLASKLTDGAKIYIPQIGEVPGESMMQGSVAGSQSHLINLNTASLSELDGLPGIGQVIGQKIIDNRPYTSINEVTSKKIVGAKVFSDIKDKITIQ